MGPGQAGWACVWVGRWRMKGESREEGEPVLERVTLVTAP